MPKPNARPMSQPVAPAGRGGLAVKRGFKSVAWALTIWFWFPEFGFLATELDYELAAILDPEHLKDALHQIFYIAGGTGSAGAWYSSRPTNSDEFNELVGLHNDANGRQTDVIGRQTTPPGLQNPVVPVDKYPPIYSWLYGKRSSDRLATGDGRLERLFRWMLPRSKYDVGIGEVSREVETQLENIRRKVSKTLDSRHLELPLAMAVDFYVLDPVTKKPLFDDSPATLAKYVHVAEILHHGAEHVFDTPIESGALDWGWDYYHIELDRKRFPKIASKLDDFPNLQIG